MAVQRQLTSSMATVAPLGAPVMSTVAYPIHDTAHKGMQPQSETGETPHEADKTNRNRGWARCGDVVGVS
jgi:hypothetical protein